MSIDELMEQIKNDLSKTEDYKIRAFSLLTNFKRLELIGNNTRYISDIIIRFFMEGDFELNVMTYLLALHMKHNHEKT